MFKLLEENEDRNQLRRSVAEFVRRQGSSDRKQDTQEIARLATMADLGWLAALLPESQGGLGLAYGDAAAISEELGRGAITDPLVPVALLAARAIALGSNNRLKRHVLPGLLAGESCASLGWQAGPLAISAADIGPVARQVEGGWQISGTANFVPLAASADALVVAAQAGNGTLLAWITKDQFASIDRFELTDGTECGHVQFKDVPVDEASLLASSSEGAALLEELLDTARLMICAELLGAMQRMFEMTVDYLKQREQFGRPIGTFQALQHRAVDLYVQIELARSALDRAIQVFDSDASAQTKAAAVSAAKSRCGDAGMLVVKQSIQLHGAIAYTEEYALSLFIKRVISLASSYGNAAVHRARYAKLELGAV